MQGVYRGHSLAVRSIGELHQGSRRLPGPPLRLLHPGRRLEPSRKTSENQL